VDVWLIVAMYVVGFVVVALLAWLAIFAVFGTAVTAGLNRLSRARRAAGRQSQTSPTAAANVVDDDGTDAPGDAVSDDTETGRLRAMLTPSD
jgi:hypothetical protein